MTAARLCRVCHEKVNGLRPVCGSCPPLMEKYLHERQGHEARVWGTVFVPKENRQARRAAKASGRTTRRPTA